MIYLQLHRRIMYSAKRTKKCALLAKLYTLNIKINLKINYQFKAVESKSF